MLISINGKFVRQIRLNGLEPEFNYGYGLFETIITYNHVPIALQAHLQRLRQSAKIIGLKIRVTNAQLEKWAKQHCHSKKETRLKIMAVPNRIYILSVPFVKTPGVQQFGVAVTTFPAARSRPTIKGLAWAQEHQANQHALAHGFFDALLINQRQQIPEASCGNVFFVKNGIVYTSDQNILFGVTRAIALRLLTKITQVKFTMPTLARLITADECFMTNSISGIIPIVRINTKTIGTGKPGPLTQQLVCLFEQYVKTACR